MSSSNELDDSNDSKTFIDKLLVEMKSEFNKNRKSGRRSSIENLDVNLKESPVLSAESDFSVKNIETHSDLPSNIANVESLPEQSNSSPENLSKESQSINKNTLQTEIEENSNVDNETKPRIVLTFRTEKSKAIVSSNYEATKDNSSTDDLVSTGRRSLRIKTNSPDDKEKKIEIEASGLKRSARRRSKDCTESILQSAIARKEKSYNETTRPQRLTRKLKPTAKILANLEMCQKSAAFKNERNRHNDNKNKNIVDSKSPNNIERQRFSYDKLEKGSEQAILESDMNYIKKEDQQQQKNSEHKNFKRKHKIKNTKQFVKKTKNLKADCIDSDSNSFSSHQETEGEKDSHEEKSPKFIAKPNQRKSSSDTDSIKPFRRSHRKSCRIQETGEEGDDQVDHGDMNEPLSISTTEEENIVVPAETSMELDENESTELVFKKCLCQYSSYIFVNTLNSPDSITYCTALDMVSDRIIGCNNVVSGEVAMLRPSTRIPYIILCEVHKQRLNVHNCCPTCGLFCTQGRFTQCTAKHLYHRDCSVIADDNSKLCPHCGLKTPEEDVEIVIKCDKQPVFLPAQKYHYPSAKMSFKASYNNTDKMDYEVRSNSPPLIPSQILELIKSTKLNVSNDFIFDIISLSDAVNANDLEKVAIILESGQVNLFDVIPNGEGMTVLHLASEKGFLAIVHILLLAGIEQDVLDKEQNTPLMLAIVSFQNDVVKYLIKNGASISLKGTDGMSALHLAAKSGNLEACKYLLSSSENRRTHINSTDDGGWTPLVWACEHGHVSVTRYLLQNGADPMLRDVEQNVALHWAAFSGSTQIMEMLFANGCEVNVVNAHGDSPLHVAARQDKYNCVLILLAHGANVNLLNQLKETALDCCVNLETDTLNDCRIAIESNIHLQKITAISANRKSTILTNDISRGKEMNPVQCINTVDNEPKPVDFLYITENCVTSDINIDHKVTTLQSCVCEDRCTTIDCLCTNNSLKCWYTDEGKLSSDFNYADPPMIFECNPACSCNAITCNNRVVQHGLTQRFQLFRTKNKGWGIRTLRSISRGTYVCEYIGEIIADLDADQREDDSYLFDLDNRVRIFSKDGETYCIDARKYGNLSRFINHSCDPNLLPVRVYINHQDLRFPRIAFFANRDIEANEELGFDYGEKFWIIKYKSFTCTCGYSLCKYSESTIQTTLDTYQKRLRAEQESFQIKEY